MAAKPSKRFWVSWLGEYYMDCLDVESALKHRTQAGEAASLLSAKLQERKEKRDAMVQYLANKHGTTFDEMWVRLRDGKYEPTEQELEELATE